MSYAEENKERVREAFEGIWGAREIPSGLFHPDYVNHANDGGAPEEEIRQRHADFDDLSARIEDMIAEGDKVVIRWSVRGTHRESGQDLDWSQIGILRLEDGQIIERWAQHNRPE